MDLDEARIADGGAKELRGRVEALDMAHLQNGPLPLRQLDHLVGFGQGRGHRLLDQDVLSGLEGGSGHRQMVDRGHGQRHRVDLG